MGVRRRLRSVQLTGSKRARQRRSQSICIVVVFVGFFVCILLTEVFLVDKQEYGTSLSAASAVGNSGFWSKLGYTPETSKEVVVPPRIARELARVIPEVLANESSEYGADDVSPTSSSSGGNNLTFPEEDHWQPVQGTRDKFYVFSAYLDERKVRTIRVVAAARTRIAERVVCVFWYGDGDPPTTVYATNKLIRENWNLKYSAYFLLCPLRRDIVTVPGEVSILKQGSNEPSNRLRVHNNKGKAEPKGLAVCVKPLHYSYNKVLDFVEFVELNRLLGVRHFVLYNHTVGPQVDCALSRYKHLGLVTLLPWNLEMTSQKEIRTEGLFAALNDCLYRTMYRFRYVIMIDLDELVVPHANASLPNMLNTLASRNPSRLGAFSFQNAFFYLQWQSDAEPLDFPLLTLLKTRRKAKLHAHKQRSKCIVMPDRVVEMGNHFVWEFMPGKTMQNVHPDTGFLHHYRVCEFGGSDCINTTFLVDRRIHAWKQPLVKAVSSALGEMKNNCQFTVARNGSVTLLPPGS